MDTLGEWSDGEDEWVFDVDENNLWEWNDSEADEIIRNIQESDQTARGENDEWNDSGDDEIIRGIQEMGKNVKAMSHCYRKRTFTKKRV